MGYVDDLQGVYARSSACVIPLLHGAGVKFKAVEAIVAGVPTVSTSVGAEGIESRWFNSVTDDPTSFAEALSAVLAHQARAERHAAAAREEAAERYGERAFAQSVARIYAGLRA